MSRDLTSVLRDVLDDKVVKAFFAIDLKFDSGELNLWTGLGSKTINGKEYTGAGNLLNFSTIEETSEIAARGATVTLSGVPSTIISIALAEPYQGREAILYLGVIGQENSSTITSSTTITSDTNISSGGTQDGMIEIFSGFMDQMNIDDSSETSTVELKIENRLIDLEKPRNRRFTNQNQKSRFPNDDGLEFVEDIQDREIPWGRKG